MNFAASGAHLLLAFGLASLVLAVSATAFAVLKWAGVAYLIYLGLTALRAPPGGLPAAPAQAPAWRRVLRDGFWAALLNPKTTLFFAAFLPQFIDPAAPALAQSLALGGAFVAIAACTDTVYVLLAQRVAAALQDLPHAATLVRRAQAAVYFGLGLLAVTTSQRPLR